MKYDEKKRIDAFLQRTGLHDYERFIRVGAFLARRVLGPPQVKYLHEVREQEAATREKYSVEGVARQDLIYGGTETDEDKKTREKYENDILAYE